MYPVLSRYLAIVLVSALILQSAMPIVLNTYALNTLYYVDATLGDDANTGGSSDPWKTLMHVSSQSFSAGDQILLKCDQKWYDTLTIDDIGALGQEIVIGTYGTCGSGNAAIIGGTGTTQIDILPGAAHIRVENITFVGGSGVTMSGVENVSLSYNRFYTTVGTATQQYNTTNTQMNMNYFDLGANVTGSDIVGGSGISIYSNTFSGGIAHIDLLNTSNATISTNTFYNPNTYSISIDEDTSVMAGTVDGLEISGNTLLTWNPSHPMIRMNDQNSSSGSLAALVGNAYINVYKSTSPLIQILHAGTGATTYSKNTIRQIDSTANTFNYFGYSSYNADGNPTDTKLFVNTGSNSTNRSCNPTTMVCSAGSQIGTDGSPITFPTSISAYSSKIILWNNPSSIQNPPTCSLVATPGGSIPNGGSVDFEWSITNSLSNIFSEPDGSGGTVETAVTNNGSGTYFPPGISSVNTYILTSTNNIGSTICSADIVTQNNAPIPADFSMTGSEDALSITGVLSAIDQNGDSITFSKFPNNAAQPDNGTLTINPLSGLVTYIPNADFCGVDTFEWRVSDQSLSSDPLFGSITVTCLNDAPIAVDDDLSASGGILSVLDVTANDTDPDSPYESQVFTVSGVTLPSEGTLIASGTVFEYTSDSGFLGMDTFTYVVIDQSGSVSNTGTVNISVGPGANTAPQVSSGTYTLNEDTSVSGVFSGSDQDGDVLAFSAMTLPSHGTLTVTGSGFLYIPNANYNGVDGFTFVADDGYTASNTATITLQINPIQDIPVAVDDTVNVEMNLVSDIDVLANDTDADNPYQPQTFTIVSISAPTHGTASILNNQIRYIPDNLYLGSDVIEYVISDQNDNISNTGTVSITVSTTNQSPTTQSGTYTLDEDTSITQTLSGSDPDMTDVTFVLDTDVTHGTLTLSSTGEFTYTPDTDYHGTDSFIFHVTDGVFESIAHTVTLMVVSVNDTPVVVNDSFTVDEDISIDIDPIQNDSDADIGDVVSLDAFTTPLHGSVTVTGSLIHYVPDADFCGQDLIEYTIVDQSGATSDIGEITMNIVCTNDAPIVYNTSLTTTGNIITHTGNILTASLTGSDVDLGDILTYTILDTPHSGSLILTGNTFTYEPILDFVGEDTFAYMAIDASGAISNTGTITLNVITNQYNTPPIAYSGVFTTNEDTLLQGTLSGSDIEGDPLVYTLDQNVGSGVLSISATGAFTYMPNSDYYGTDSFIFYISDGQASSGVTIDITIEPINDSPDAVDDVLNTLEDTEVMINPVLNDYDRDRDTFTLSHYTQGLHGAVTSSGDILTYTPLLNYCGTDTIEYRVTDTAMAVSNTGTINITLTCVNDVPTASGDIVSAVEDIPLLIYVLANDSDVDGGDSLSVTNLTQPSSGGRVSIIGTGVTFTPTANFCTSDPTTFTYQARDTANALSDITTVTIDSIACINDAPTSANMSYTMTGNTVISSGTMLTGGILTGYLATTNSIIQNLSYVDLDGDPIVFSGMSLPLHGTGVITATGLLAYIPNPGYIGNDTMTFVVSDAAVSSIIYTITFIVRDPNPPIYIAPISGPGGGGGGGSSIDTAILSRSSYTAIATSPDTNTGLISQLFLTRPILSGSTSVSGVASGALSSLRSSYREYLVPIIESIESADGDTISSRERATMIRQSGQKLIHSISRSLVLSSLEKSAEIRSIQSEMQTLNKYTVPTPESRALAYIIRLLKREHTKIEKGINTLKYLMAI